MHVQGPDSPPTLASCSCSYSVLGSRDRKILSPLRQKSYSILLVTLCRVQAEQELRALLEQKEEFISLTTQELKAPLESVISLTAELLDRGKAEDYLRLCLQRVAQGVSVAEAPEAGSSPPATVPAAAAAAVSAEERGLLLASPGAEPSLRVSSSSSQDSGAEKAAAAGGAAARPAGLPAAIALAQQQQWVQEQQQQQQLGASGGEGVQFRCSCDLGRSRSYSGSTERAAQAHHAYYDPFRDVSFSFDSPFGSSGSSAGFGAGSLDQAACIPSGFGPGGSGSQQQQGLAGAAAGDEPLAPEAARAVAAIHNSSISLLNLIEDLLDAAELQKVSAS